MVEKALTDGETGGADVPAADECRALIPLAISAPRHRRVTSRPVAFLAHLIAVKENHPQTRARRRVEPAEAVDAYRAGMMAAEKTSGSLKLSSPAQAGDRVHI